MPGLSELTDLDIEPSALYRTFGEEKHAADFVAGRIWISTLAYCRSIEDAIRRDPDEGRMRYVTEGPLRGDSDDPIFAEIARRSGVRFTNSKNILLINCQTRQTVPDGLVICMSKKRLDKFGRYCVRIDSPLKMFKVISDALQAAGYIKANPGHMKGLITGVDYRSRELKYPDPEPVHPGAVKPKIFEDEYEVRMLWPLLKLGPAPFMLTCEAAKKYCTPIP